MPVFTSDGVELGKVHRVQDNAREHIFDGILVRTPRGRVFVDAPEVARITETRVTLTINAEQAKALPEQPQPQQQRARGWRRWFSR